MTTKIDLAVSSEDALKTLSGLAGIGFEATEKFSALSFEMARASFEDSTATLSALSVATAPKAVMTAFATTVEPAMMRAVGYLRACYGVASEAGAAVNALLAPRYAAINKDLDKAIETLSATTPVGGEVIAKAMKSAMSATQSAFEDAAKTTRQVVEMTEANINKATDAAVKATAKAAKKVA